MHQLLKDGEKVYTEDGKSCSIGHFIGGGGQGEVYQATLDGKPVAVKWYFQEYLSGDDTLRSRLVRAIEKGAPSPRFLWPMALVKKRGGKGLGYLMPLREARYCSLTELMNRTVEPNLESLARAGFELAESFGNLHLAGLCYRDISFGNIFLDPETGEILICDNDNVDVNGEAAGILGTPRFIAPEVVRGEAMPSTLSDQYSLATLLFYMLMTHHPLEGRKEYEIHALDLPAMNKLYGTEPVFIFDPQDDSNRPVQGAHDNALIFWEIYPEFLRRKFTKAFTEGIRDPRNGRIVESQWKGDMVRLWDSILHCHHCGSEVFYDPERLKSEGQLQSCWDCRSVPKLGYRIRFSNKNLDTHVGSSVVILNRGSKLYPHHVDPSSTFDFSHPVAEVAQHPTNPGLLGLRNLTQRPWHGKRTGGELQQIPPGKNFSLRNGATVDFGRVSGGVRC